MSDMPERIWLQTHLGLDTTWCNEQIEDSDVEYVRADKHRALWQRLDEMAYALEAGNLDREPIKADVLADWIRYVKTGEET